MWGKYKKWPVYSKFFDNLGPIPHHMHQSAEQAALLGREGKERKHNLTGKVEPVGIDDACAFLCRFDNGSLGLFESTRYARGHKALYTFEINGEKASIKWDLHDLHRLQWFDHRDAGNLR